VVRRTCDAEAFRTRETPAKQPGIRVGMTLRVVARIASHDWLVVEGWGTWRAHGRAVRLRAASGLSPQQAMLRVRVRCPVCVDEGRGCGNLSRRAATEH